MTNEDPWTVGEADYPEDGGAEDRLAFLVRYAVLAPSGHNTQPWLFRVQEGRLELIADRTRCLPVVDPEDRALVISCGAALFNLAVAASRFGDPVAIERLPDPAQPDLLATLRFEDGADGIADAQELFAAIRERRTTRRKYDDKPLPKDLLKQLSDDARRYGAGLEQFTETADKERIAALVVEGDRAQFGDPSFRRELASWIHSRRAATKDGISAENMMGMPDMLSFAGAWAVRTFDMGDGLAAKDEEIAAHSPTLAVLHTPRDKEADWLAAGEAMQNVLLRLTAAGATYAFLNQPIEVSALRPRLRDAAGIDGQPQILLRMGYGPDMPPAVRRPVAEVMID